VELAIDAVGDISSHAAKEVGGTSRWPSSLGADGWVALVAALYAIAFVAWVIVAGGTDHTSTVVSDVAFLPIGIGAALMAWRAAAHPALDRGMKRAWILIGLAFFSWWCGDVIWFWFESIRGVQPFPSWADAGYLCFYLLLLAGLLSMPGAPKAALDRTKVWLDAGTVVLGGTMAIWYLVINGTVAGHEAHLLNKVLSVAYPVGDLVLVFGVAMLLLRRPGRGSAAALRLLVVGASLFVVADVTYARLNLSNSYNGPGVPDIFWMLALASFLVAGVVQRRLAAQPPDPDAGELAPARVSKLPYLALAVGYGFMLWVAGRQAVSPLNGLVVGAVGLTLLVAARQMAAQQENLRLTTELVALATVDPLTGLHNRRSFFEVAEREWTRTARSGAPLTAVMVDVDHFKSINDRCGHAAGDDVLAAVARRCLEELRSVDVLGRYGGDEFIALLPDSATVDAVAVAERVRAAVAAAPVSTDVGPIEVHISVGVATAAGGATSLRALLSQADAALYAAKGRGRNQSQAWYPGITVPS
jgi:diguanylate cyclase (GGDEF)-like protein